MAFKLIGSLDPHGGPVLRTHIITDDVELTELDSVKAVLGFVSLGTAAVLVLGHIKSIVTYDGVGVTSDGAGGNFGGTYTMSATNETVLKTSATIDISKNTLYTVAPNATIGSTNSEKMGYFIDLQNEYQTNETSALSTTLQYSIHGLDPLNSANHVVSINRSVIFGV